MAGLTLLRVVDNATMMREERELAEKALAERQNQPMILGLVSHLRACWDVAQQAKKPIENIMLKALRQRNGEYDADKLQQIRAQGGSEIYMMITEVKCRAAESWLRDIMLDTGTPPWDIVATPIPDLSPAQVQDIQDITALPKFGSLEFRALESSTDWAKLEAWIALHVAIKDAAVKLRPSYHSCNSLCARL